MHHYERQPQWRRVLVTVRAVAVAALLSLNHPIAGAGLVAGAAAPPTAATTVSTPVGPSLEPHVRWARHLGGPIAAPPAVTATAVYVGTETGDLVALDVVTGATRWQVVLPAPVQAPAVTRSLVFVASGRLLLAFDAVRGERRWTVTADHVLSGPAVASGLVYAGSWGGRLTALVADTGDTAWQAQTDEATVLSVPTIAGDTVLVSSETGAVYAFDARTGSRRWRMPTGPGPGPPRVAGTIVYIGSGDGTLVALDVSSGYHRWQVAVAPVGHCCGAPTIADGTLYLGLKEGLIALDAHTGAVRWRWGSGIYQVSAPTLVDDTIYAGGSAADGAHRHAGLLIAVDARTGRERWRLATDDWVSAAPVPSGQGIIVGTWSGRLLNLAPAGDAVRRRQHRL